MSIRMQEEHWIREDVHSAEQTAASKAYYLNVIQINDKMTTKYIILALVSTNFRLHNLDLVATIRICKIDVV